MKITAIRPLIVNAKMRNWIFVKVETDEGVTGWGEASLEWKTRAVAGAIADFEPFVVGEDPRRIEHLVPDHVAPTLFSARHRGVSAMSGIEQALLGYPGQEPWRPGL